MGFRPVSSHPGLILIKKEQKLNFYIFKAGFTPSHLKKDLLCFKMSEYLWKPEGIRSCRIGVIGDCELSEISVGK